MLKINKQLLYYGALVISVAIISFILFRLMLEQSHVEERVDKKVIIENSDKNETKWRGHKWYALQTSKKQSSQLNETSSHLITQEAEDSNEQATALETVMVNVWLQEENKIEVIPLEQYVLAVTLAEMPWNFHDEAIKAQMIAARTYIMYRLNQVDQDEVKYNVTNTTTHQVLEVIDERTMSEQKKDRYEQLKNILESTLGQVITYKGNVIDALYFSTSNGKTEASVDYFGGDHVYLKSVSSKWDTAISTSYEQSVQFSYAEFLNKLNVVGLIEKNQKHIDIAIIERTPSNRIKELNVNGVKMSGKQFREALGLASTDFSWKLDNKDKTITISTKGYGHGVGMSQWGAEGMAREGYTYEQILNHYYSNIEIESL